MRIQAAICFVLVGTTLILGAAACVESDAEPTAELQSAVGGPPAMPTLSVPALSAVAATRTTMNIQLCAGATGAPAGFSLQWMTASAYSDNGWSDAAPAYCYAGFSGAPPQSTFALGAGDCRTLTIGNLDPALVGLSFAPGCNEDLTCGTAYVFRAFAHASSSFKRSPFTDAISGTTTECNQGCTFSQGYWKTHDDTAQDVWPVSLLTLGSVEYSRAQLGSILQQAPAGNGLVSLAHQLIAAKLNIANGAADTAIAGTIVSADGHIGALVVPPVGNGFLPPDVTIGLTSALTSYNEGTIGPGHCE